MLILLRSQTPICDGFFRSGLAVRPRPWETGVKLTRQKKTATPRLAIKFCKKC